MLHHFMFFIISTMRYQVNFFQLYWSMLTYDRHLKKDDKTNKKMLEISWYRWPWQCRSYRPLQGFWFYRSKVIICKTRCMWRRYKFAKNDNGSYLNFGDTFSGVSQGSIFRPLLFNIYICDLFFGIGDLDMVSYADDNMPCTFSSEVLE